MRLIQRLYCLLHSFFLSYFLRISWLAILLSLRFWHKSDQHDRAFLNAIGSVLKLSCQTVKAGESRFLLWIDLIRKEQIQLTIHKLWFHSLAALSIWFILYFSGGQGKDWKGRVSKIVQGCRDSVTKWIWSGTGGFITDAVGSITIHKKAPHQKRLAYLKVF